MLFVASTAAVSVGQGSLMVDGIPQVTCDPGEPGKCMCGGKPIGPKTWSPPSWLKSNHTSIYDTSAYMNGELKSLSVYKAKASMLVNVASA